VIESNAKGIGESVWCAADSAERRDISESQGRYNDTVAIAHVEVTGGIQGHTPGLLSPV